MHGEKLKIEEKYAKSKAKVKILETIESEYRKRKFNEIANTKDERTKLLMKNSASNNQTVTLRSSKCW